MKLIRLVIETAEANDPFVEPSKDTSTQTERDVYDRLQRKADALTHAMELARDRARQLFTAGIISTSNMGNTGSSILIKPSVDLRGKFAMTIMEMSWFIPNTLPPSDVKKVRQFADYTFDLIQRYKTVMKATQKAMKAAMAARQKQDTSSVSNTKIPEAQIPQKVDSGKGKFENPYFQSPPGNRFAGHPDHYSWSSQMQKIYYTIKDALARNGLAPMDVMYAGKRNGGSEFAVIGAGGSLVWRKYDPSPGAGQNWLYINGKQMHTSSFVSASVASQDAWLAPLKHKP